MVELVVLCNLGVSQMPFAAIMQFVWLYVFSTSPPALRHFGIQVLQMGCHVHGYVWLDRSMRVSGLIVLSLYNSAISTTLLRSF